MDLLMGMKMNGCEHHSFEQSQIHDCDLVLRLESLQKRTLFDAETHSRPEEVEFTQDRTPYILHLLLHQHRPQTGGVKC